MNLPPRWREEIRSVGLTTLYFAAWFSVLMALKALVLTEYQIEFFGIGRWPWSAR